MSIIKRHDLFSQVKHLKLRLGSKYQIIEDKIEKSLGPFLKKLINLESLVVNS